MIGNHFVRAVISDLIIELAGCFGMAVPTFKITFVSKADFYIFRSNWKLCTLGFDLIVAILSKDAAVTYVSVTNQILIEIFNVPTILA
jgi:hypothetical protein